MFFLHFEHTRFPELVSDKLCSDLSPWYQCTNIFKLSCDWFLHLSPIISITVQSTVRLLWLHLGKHILPHSIKELYLVYHEFRFILTLLCFSISFICTLIYISLASKHLYCPEWFLSYISALLSNSMSPFFMLHFLPVFIFSWDPLYPQVF